MNVHLENGKDLQVLGKGPIDIETSYGKRKFLHNVQYLPDLGYNL